MTIISNREDYMSTNTLQHYMGQIDSYPRISVTEEIDLANRIAGGCALAQEKLTLANLKLVVKIAHDFKNFGLPLVDLISEGNIGLMKAVEKFKPGMGAKFSSYAAWWIKQAIRKAISNQKRLIRMPIQSNTRMREIKKTSEKLKRELKRDPNIEEISKQMEISPRCIKALLMSANSPTISINTKLTNGEKGTLEDLLPDLHQLSPDDSLDKKQIKILLKKIISEKLNSREKIIIIMRYGLDDGTSKTLEEVSQFVGKTRERIRQLQHSSLKKIKLFLNNPKLII